MQCYTYDVVNNAVNDARHSDASNLPSPFQKFVRQIPSIFCRGYLRDDPPPNPENFVKIWPIVSEKFLKPKLFFSANPFAGGPDAKIFWVLKGPLRHKKFRVPRTSHFGDIRGQSFNFPTSSPKIGSSDPLSIFTKHLTEQPRNTGRWLPAEILYVNTLNARNISVAVWWM